MIKVLLLGGTRHLDTTRCDSNFPTPITSGNGTATVARYDRAVFRNPISGASVDRFWYLYESDDYRGSKIELPLVDIHQALVDESIPPTNAAIDVINLAHERTIREVPKF